MEKSLLMPLLRPADEVSPAAGDGRGALAAGDGGKIDGLRTSDEPDSRATTSDQKPAQSEDDEPDSTPTTSDQKTALPVAGDRDQSGGSPFSHEGDSEYKNLDDAVDGVAEEQSGGTVEGADSEERNQRPDDDAAEHGRGRGRYDSAVAGDHSGGPDQSEVVGEQPSRSSHGAPTSSAAQDTLPSSSSEGNGAPTSSAAQDTLLSSSEGSDRQQASRPGQCAFLWSWLASIWGPEPTLPVHRLERQIFWDRGSIQEKLAEKRQALFGLALAAPLALLTSAASTAGVQVFPSAFGPWIAWIGALLWIAVSCGILMDLFGKTRFEFELASCLRQLGMTAVTVLFCLFVFGAFYPTATEAMWAIVASAVLLHILLCVLSRTRGGN